MEKNHKPKVVLGLSGGVDSAVSCHLLLKQGYEVIPVFMQNWDTVINNDIKGHNKSLPDGCESNVDYLAAKQVADFFHLKLHKVEFIKEYWDDVFKYFIAQYKKSLTPNPDVLCNKYIKFEAFRKFALDHGFDLIAMGHYAKRIDKNNKAYLAQLRDWQRFVSKELSPLIWANSCKPIQLAQILTWSFDFYKNMLRTICAKSGLILGLAQKRKKYLIITLKKRTLGNLADANFLWVRF